MNIILLGIDTEKEVGIILYNFMTIIEIDLTLYNEVEKFYNKKEG